MALWKLLHGLIFTLEPSTYDIRIGRGRGVTKMKKGKLRESFTVDQLQMRKKGEGAGGPNILKFCGRHVWMISHQTRLEEIEHWIHQKCGEK